MTNHSRKLRCALSSGLHARPAKLFAQTAKDSGLATTITKGDSSVNGASILAIIALGVERDDEITITVEGEKAQAAPLLAELCSLLTTESK